MTVTTFLVVLAACGSSGNDATGTLPAVERCVDFNPTRNAYFGDLHVHTRYSLDASTQGTEVGPHDAYRFALGERIPVQPYDENGKGLRSTQIVRPLDFAAITDHAEFFGEVEVCTNPEYAGYNSAECQFYREDPPNAFLTFNAQLARRGEPNAQGRKSVSRFSFCGPGGVDCLEAAKTPWTDTLRAAEAFYDRSAECTFTTFVGYEWTGSPESNNWHRNVIFKSDTVPMLPVSYFEAAAPEYLWAGLDETCRTLDGCEVLTIPHNSNISAGIMFEQSDDNELPFTTEFAQAKQFNEPLVEVMQHKGQSECLNMGASAADELCGFEILPYNNLAGSRLQNTNPPLEQDFIRHALKEGLELENNLSVNPFKYGMISSSDTHISAPGEVIEDAGFPGHGGAGQPNREMPLGLTDLIEYNPGGLAVLYAEQNTRESLYEAMRRREAYGTSGPRMAVRFFGGTNFPSDMCDNGEFVEQGYLNGVPMGGDLSSLPAGAKPQFALWALRDPGAEGEISVPLQRMQIIKGWQDASGTLHEEVMDVAGSANNGAGVDTASCEIFGEGANSLCAVWEDKDFDADERAFYYARVVQNPSCRWSGYQCAAAGVTEEACLTLPPNDPFAACCDTDYPRSIQERAWTSPIWYTPGG